MAELTQAPDYGQVLVETESPATVDALKGLWYQEKSDILNVGRVGQLAKNIISPQVYRIDTGSDINDLSIGEASIIYIVPSVNINLSGVVSSGQDGRLIIIFNNSSNVVNIKHVGGASESANRFVNATTADVPCALGLPAAGYLYMVDKWYQIF